jgi:putative flippase GtrA
MRARLLEVVRFVLVGVLATGVHIAVSLASLRLLHVPPLVANACGFCVGLFFSMAGHSLFTFRQPMTQAKAIRFTLVALSSVVFSSVLVFLGQRYSTLPADVYLVAAAVLTPVYTYLCHSLWTFRHPGEVG